MLDLYFSLLDSFLIFVTVLFQPLLEPLGFFKFLRLYLGIPL